MKYRIIKETRGGDVIMFTTSSRRAAWKIFDWYEDIEDNKWMIHNHTIGYIDRDQFWQYYIKEIESSDAE